MEAAQEQLDYAFSTGNVGLANIILARNRQLFTEENLMVAVEAGDFFTVEVFISNGVYSSRAFQVANDSMRDVLESQYSIFDLAVRNQDLQRVDKLLAAGIATQESLDYAIRMRLIPILRLYLEYGKTTREFLRCKLPDAF